MPMFTGTLFPKSTLSGCSEWMMSTAPSTTRQGDGSIAGIGRLHSWIRRCSFSGRDEFDSQCYGHQRCREQMFEGLQCWWMDVPRTRQWQTGICRAG
jgi:hypothetical protein